MRPRDRRIVAVFLIFPLMWGATAFGQDWARQMFRQTRHDFGYVARGAKAEFEFVLENIYLEDVHIASVRSSCGCTTPRIKKALLKTYEKGAIVAAFNTRSFVGRKGATVTVTFDKPLYAEVRLHVTGYIRRDVVLDPPSARLGTVARGTPAETTVAVTYAGRSDWRIVEVRSDNPHLSGEAVETARRPGRVAYDLRVRLGPGVPPGYVNDRLLLVTNDDRARQIPVRVEGRVAAAVTVSPGSLFLGAVRPGAEVTKQIVVRARAPLRIVAITCDDESFRFGVRDGDSASPLHIIPVTFVAGKHPGKVSGTIRIETDTGSPVLRLPAYAVVTSP